PNYYCRNRPERPDQVPSRSASSALALCARRRSQICQVCSRRSPDETPAPRPAPGNAGLLPGRLDRPQLEYLMAERLHHLALECRPAAPAEESNSLTTAGSRACRGCLLTQPRTPQSTDPHPRNRRPVSPSRSLVGLHTLEGFPDFPFGDQKRPCLVHGLLQLPDGRSWAVVSAEQRTPFAPPPLQRLHHYYG